MDTLRLPRSSGGRGAYPGAPGARNGLLAAVPHVASIAQMPHFVLRNRARCCENVRLLRAATVSTRGEP